MQKRGLVKKIIVMEKKKVNTKKLNFKVIYIFIVFQV